MKWFRVYNDILTDPKLRILGRESCWILTQLMAFINENFRKSGSISREELQTFSSIVGTTLPKCLKIVEKAIELEIMHRAGDFYHLTNWHKRQFESDSSAERTRRWRLRRSQSDATGTVTVTAPETETESESEEDDLFKKRSPSSLQSEMKPKSTTPRCPYEMIRKLFNSTCTPPLEVVHELTSTERKRIQARWRDQPSIDPFLKVFQETKSGPWLLGDNPSGWQATLLWIVKLENWDKILTGEYRRHDRKRPDPPGGKTTQDYLNELEV